MAENNALWDELNDFLVGFQEQKNQIFESFQKLITAVLLGSITSEKEIRNLIDSLGDFCDEERFLFYIRTCFDTFI